MKNLARAAATVGAIIGIAAMAAPAASAASTTPEPTPATAEATAPEATPETSGATAPEATPETSEATAPETTPATAPEAAPASDAPAAAPTAPQATPHHQKAKPDHITIYYFEGDALLAQEYGPGDQANYLTKDSKHVSQPAQNEVIKTGDIKPAVVGKHNNVPIEVEGSEQDQGEAA
ncbi:hypothetical protein GCM10010400_09060 [Streptomyces aculeolatus]|uniref:hypothetical protein n=1 Tax=Streptomyces aculeolatus TaxID=270689 RepID=UPI001CEE06A9|nr:hypothetical protein [Streptomyces aculeolatus]